MGCVRVGKGRVLVLVHGFLSGLAYWENQIENLSTHFEVIAMDLPGYGGETQEVGYDKVADFAANILKKLDSLGVENFHLLGHSMGGMIAQEIALTAPDRVNRLVLYGTGPNGEMPGRFEPLEDSMKKIQKDGAEEAKCYTVPTWFKKGTEDPNFESGMEMASDVSLQTYINALRAMGGWTATGRLDQIQSKTLVVWGDLDRSYPWELQPYILWRQIKNACLAVMPDCSHNAHLENPELFNRLLFDFLTQD